MIACSAGRLEVVKYLVKLPYVNVNSANCNGQTALHYASSRNHPQVCSTVYWLKIQFMLFTNFVAYDL